MNKLIESWCCLPSWRYLQWTHICCILRCHFYAQAQGAYMCVENVTPFTPSFFAQKYIMSFPPPNTPCVFHYQAPLSLWASPSLLSTHFLSAVILPVSLLLGKIRGAVCVQSKDYRGSKDYAMIAFFYFILLPQRERSVNLNLNVIILGSLATTVSIYDPRFIDVVRFLGWSRLELALMI